MAVGIGPAELIMVMIVAAVVITVPVVVVVLIARAVARPSQSTYPDPRAVLADRLARGEISRDEFDTAMRALGVGD